MTEAEKVATTEWIKGVNQCETADQLATEYADFKAGIQSGRIPIACKRPLFDYITKTRCRELGVTWKHDTEEFLPPFERPLQPIPAGAPAPEDANDVPY